MGAAFALSFAGIVFVVASRNAPAKRIVLPLTLLVFSSLFFLLFRQAEFATRVPPLVIVLALVLNAAWVWRAIAYCSRCGRTVQQPVTQRDANVLCEECKRRATKPASS